MITRLLDRFLTKRIRAVLFMLWLLASTLVFLVVGFRLLFRPPLFQTILGVILLVYGIIPVAVWWDIRQNGE